MMFHGVLSMMSIINSEAFSQIQTQVPKVKSSYPLRLWKNPTPFDCSLIYRPFQKHYDSHEPFSHPPFASKIFSFGQSDSRWPSSNDVEKGLQCCFSTTNSRLSHQSRLKTTIAGPYPIANYSSEQRIIFPTPLHMFSSRRTTNSAVLFCRLSPVCYSALSHRFVFVVVCSGSSFVLS